MIHSHYFQLLCLASHHERALTIAVGQQTRGQGSSCDSFPGHVRGYDKRYYDGRSYIQVNHFD